MLSRTRIALGLVLLLSLLISVTVSAKGGFDYITISGPDLEEAVLVTNTALTEDFFTFANFSEDRTKAPADPGQGYEILRYYKEGIGARAFDRLHYYPESGFVFYDGIEGGGWSEYDDQWYTANPAIKPIFEASLAVPAVQPAAGQAREPATAASLAGTRDSAASAVQSPPVTFIVAASGVAALAAFALFAIRRRKVATR